MLRTLPLKKGEPQGLRSLGFSLYLLFPSEAVPTAGTMPDRTSSRRTRSGAALFLKPEPYFSRMVKNGIPAARPITHRRSEGARQQA
jgi:hypothetical protein